MRSFTVCRRGLWVDISSVKCLCKSRASVSGEWDARAKKCKTAGWVKAQHFPARLRRPSGGIIIGDAGYIRGGNAPEFTKKQKKGEGKV